MTDNNKRTSTFTRKKLPHYIRLASGASLLAMGAAMPAFAQDSEADDGTLEEVVVTGQRASILSAQAIKQDAEQVVDAINAVDIGALPDRSISEALQRVPGVQLQRTNEARDPARLAAEGGGVFVRGLSWVRTELNGRDIFSASGGRSLSFEDVSADLLAGIDVYKSPTADQVEGGLGGTVNLRTRLPLEQNGRLLSFSADYNYADLYGEGFTSGSGLYSDRWDVGEGEIGVLFSASLAEIGNRTDAIQSGRYEPQQLEDGSTVYLPTGLGFRRVDWEQERNAYNGVFQWAPNDELTFTAQAFYSEANPEDIENAVGINGPGAGNLAPWMGDFQYNEDGVLESGTLNDSTLAYNTRYGKRESSVGDYSLKFEYTPSERWAFSGDLQYVESKADVLSMTAFTGILADENGSYPETTFDFSGSDPSLSVSDQARLSQADQYWWAAAMDHLEENQADSLAGRIDAEYNFEDDSFLRSFRFGARATDKDTTTRQTGYNWALLSNQYWLNNSAENTAFLHESAVGQSELFTYDDFMRGDVGVPTVGWFPTESLVSSNTGAYEHFESIAANNGVDWSKWAPLIPPEAYDLNPRSDNVSAGINEQNEKTQAIYASLRFGDDSGEMLGLPFDGNFGVRVVETETTAYGRSVAGGITENCDSSDCAGAQAFVDAYLAELGDYKGFTDSYTNVLPSLNLRFMLQDDLQLRFGLSRGMVRPSFSQTRPYTSISFDFQGEEFNPEAIADGVQGSATGGAPALKPTVADQFDSSIEWYFNDAGSLTFAAFYKDIQDYVALVTSTEEFTYGGQTYAFETTRQTNAASGKLKGFEVAYQQFYDMLPSPFDGLGLQANFTYIDNEGGVNTALNPFAPADQQGATNETLPIEGMSKTSYNLALMYEKYDVSARLAYNWRERYLLTSSAANIERPVFFGDFGQLDGSVFYNATDNLKFGLQVTNILNSRTELDVLADGGQDAQYSWTDTDRRIAFVTRYSF
ncbi:TonB-dependent receptor [Microbulbifer sp.]|uniref:TonB-dependent receptor n=1 Tax=Microbulbifer sp. TaxID=1908541 RepID=UPI003F2F92C8